MKCDLFVFATKEWDLVVELNMLREMNNEKQNIIDQLLEQIKELQSEVLTCKCKGRCQQKGDKS